MLTSRYSRPEFNPYGDDSPTDSNEPWIAPTAIAPVSGTVSLPGSKSLTNRELVLAALADGESVLRRPLYSRDTNLMIEGLRALGTQIDPIDGTGTFGPDLRIRPAEELTGSTTIDCGLAGTVMRFLPPVAGLALGPTTFDGDDAARRRPMAGIVDGLLSLGVDISDDGRKSLPFTVHGRGMVAGGDVTIDASSSSQFVSGLLLSAARFEHGLTLRHTGERLPSMPHIDMTVAALAARGVVVHSDRTEALWSVEPSVISAVDTVIEPDLSNAAPFLIAALATRGTVRVLDWPEHTTQAGNDLLQILPQFGAQVGWSDGVLTVSGPEQLSGVELDLSSAGELAPALVALAALAPEASRITGIGHIRHHETDRLAALTAELNGLGGDAVELEDGIELRPATLHAGVWHTYDDHRMAHAGAVIGLLVPGVEVENIGTTGKTLPEFPQLWRELVEDVTA